MTNRKSRAQNILDFGTIVEKVKHTEPLQVQQELERTVSLLNATLESIADGIVVVDLAGNTAAFNQKFLQMWHLSEEMVEPKNTQARLALIASQLKDPEGFLKRVTELTDRPEAEGYDIVEFKDGKIFERYSRPQWLGGKVIGRVWNFRDVTEQMRAEEILRQNEASMAAAQRIAHLGNWISNLQTGHLYWSDEIYRIFGLAPQEFSATVDEFFSRVHPDDLDYVNKALEDAIARRRDYNVNHRIIRDNGEVRFVHQEGEITFDETGKPLQMFGIVQDITEQKQVEDALRQNEASLAAAQRIAHVGNWETDITTGALHWSDEIYRIFGLAPREFSATVDAFFSRIHPDDLEYVLKEVDEVYNGRKPYNVDHRIIRANGEVGYVHQEAEVTFDETGKPLRMLGIVQDVTERKLLEQQLQEALERRNRQVQLSVQVAQEIAAATNLGDLYRRVITRVNEQFGLHNTQLFSYEPDHEILTLVASYDEAGKQMLAEGQRIKLGDDLISLAAAIGTSALSSDISGASNGTPYSYPPHTKSELAVPITLGGEDIEVQVAALKNFIRLNFDGYMVVPLDVAAVTPLAHEAVRIGKKVVTIGADLGTQNQTSLILSVEQEMGYLLGQQAGEWAKKHVPVGEIVKIGLLTYVNPFGQLIQREKAIIEAIKEEFGDNFTVIRHEVPGSPATGLLEWLNLHSDMKMIVSVTDGLALDAYQAVIAVDKNDPTTFFLGGVDALPEALAAIKSAGAFQATVTQSAKEMGILALQTLVAAIKNLPYEKNNPIKHVPVNLSNVDQFLNIDSQMMGVERGTEDVFTGLDLSEIKVGFGVLNLTNPFFVTMSEAVKEEAKRLGIQLFINDPKRVLGVLDVQSHEAGSLNADDQLALEGLCAQIATAIESTRLRQEMEDRLHELNTLQRLMSREGWQAFQAGQKQTAQAYLFDQTSIQATTLAELRLPANGMSQKEITGLSTEGSNGHLVAKPMAVRGETIGMLGIQDDAEAPLSPEDQAFLDAVAEQVAEALERARLLEQTQKRAMEMETLSQVSQRLSAVLDPQQLIAEVVEQVGVAFNYYYTQIYLFDQARENLVLTGGSGETGRLLLARQHSLPKGRGLVGRAAEQNKIVLIPDVHRSIRPEIISQANLEDVYRRETDPVVEAEWYAQYMAHYFDDVKAVQDWLAVNPERTEKALKLGYVLHVPGAFPQMIRRGVEAAARDLQVEVEFVAPARQGEHLPLFEAMVRQEKDGLVVVPDRPDWVEPIRQAMTAKIPVVTANRDLKFSPALMHVGLDNFQAGVMLARELVKLLQAAGQEKGKILVGTGIADRNAGVRHGLRDTNYTLIEIEGFLEDASFLQTYWEQALSRHPDLTAVMGLTAPEAPILAEIKRRTGGEWLLVGFDLELATLEAIREGIVQVTIGQHPYLQAYLPILALVEHLCLDKSLEGWMAEGWLPNPLLTETQAEVAVPIVLGDQVLGVLDVQHNVAGSLRRENANLLRSVADQVAIALQNAQLLSQTQAALTEMQQSQELLRATIDSTPDWIFIKDRSHRYQMVNQGYANSLHLTPEDFIGKNDLALGFPEDIVKGNPEKGIRGFWADDLEVMDSGKTKHIEVEPAVVDGRPVFLSTIKVPLSDSTGNVWGVLGVVRDITQREQLLAEAENLFKASRRVNEAQDLQGIVAAVAESGPASPINRVVLFTFEHNSLGQVEAMTVAANWHSGQGTAPSPVGRRYDRATYATVELMLTAEPLFFNDVQHDERMDSPIIAVAQQQNIRAMVVLPLQVGDRSLGVLLLQAEEIHPFTPGEIQFYLSLSPQIVVALDNQRLLAETRNALAEVERTQRRYTVQAWESYRDKLTTLSYEQVREGVSSLEAELLPEINQLIERPQTTDHRPQLVSGGLPSVVSGQGSEAGSSLIIPLSIRGETIGVLGLQEVDEQRIWSPEEMALIEAISEQLAQAAENIRLIDETQQRAAREQRVNEIGEKIQAAQSLEEALKIAVKEVGLSLRVPQTTAKIEVK